MPEKLHVLLAVSLLLVPSTASHWLGPRALLMATCGFARTSAWHAWVGNEALPTKAGTNLESFLELPSLSGGLSNLSLPLTSLKKITEGSKCMVGQRACSLECATAWGSFLRDTRPIIGRVAPVLKDTLRIWFPGGFAAEDVVQPLSNVEFAYMSLAMCLDAYKCSPHHCTPEVVDESSDDGTSSDEAVASLQPGDCSAFSVQDGAGAWALPFLTWRAVHEWYVPRALGHVGGLGLLADREHSVWACVYQPLCTHFQVP